MMEGFFNGVVSGKEGVERLVANLGERGGGGVSSRILGASVEAGKQAAVGDVVGVSVSFGDVASDGEAGYRVGVVGRVTWEGPPWFWDGCSCLEG